MKHLFYLLVSGVMAFGLIIGIHTQASAAPNPTFQLFISDGFNTVSFFDNDLAFDSNPAVGVINYSPAASPFAGWTVVTSLDQTKPVLGSINFPQMHLGVEATSSGPAADLLIELISTVF